ncbi:MAG: hypothetical protein R3286_15635, partial [Gammaproteobacteria bacterium]|nr:hypothetical protein [Gammaproteobacteria bacterium]
NYERIMADTATDTEVPTVTVAEAEVEHGRIAIEALTAVEVQPVAAEQLSSVEVNELPRQLVLKTTNPILLAYKYVHAEPPYRLVLAITRHQEIDVQVAAIENASYSTLYTSDGLAVTTARFDVRNSRRQFLRLEMPPESQIWSVFVDGRAEKPAQAGAGGDEPGVLVKMINSASGFPVEMVYATRVDGMGFSGRLSGRLPNPDMVVTRTRWDVYLPADASYRTPDSTLDLVVPGRPVNGAAMSRAAANAAAHDASQSGEPLRISVPTQGIHFGFEKLYANQSPEAAEFTVGYTSAKGNEAGLWLSVLGALLTWLGILGVAGVVPRVERTGALALVAAGVIALVAAIGYLGASPLPASALALAIGALLGLWRVSARIRAWRAERGLAAP